ncbi:TlpA disulfide reductase family protein [Terribacillus saccharophilus]|uniref:TlpA family protein disulfide reductase n=1 Tax=Terribacillus saccharophilus TaxID=361277 RepID=UPI00398275D4
MKRGLILLSIFLFILPTMVRADAAELKSVEELVQSADGKPVVIMYWATWCETCLSDLSELEDFYAAAGEKVDVYSVNATNSERSEKQVQAFIRQSALKVPVFLDKDGSIAKEFRQVAVPFTILVDRKGKHRVIPGPVTKQQLEEWIQ